MMHAYFSDDQLRHHGKTFIVAGERKPIPEVPERAEILSGAVSRLGLSLRAPRDFGMDPIAAIHDANYLTFLQTIYQQWQAAGGSELVIPNIHPFDRNGPYPRHHVGKAGFHLGDTSCPVSETTWYSAYASAQTAIAATRHVRDDGADTAYALCRPPGHHASSNIAGGFCYLNNSAIAAQELRAKYDKVAILDVDLHHGNGTQDLFWNDPDLFYCSTHQWPLYPGTGAETERGCPNNILNVGLESGSGTAELQHAFTQTVLPGIAAFKPELLIISAGFDAHKNDPLAGLTFSDDDFVWMTQQLMALADAQCQGRVVSILEGGYDLPSLAKCVLMHVRTLMMG